MQVGVAGTLQDLNVAISRAKEKLIIVGNFGMMLY
jgi:superfamily I DNA and/or RNA helicase